MTEEDEISRLQAEYSAKRDGILTDDKLRAPQVAGKIFLFDRYHLGSLGYGKDYGPDVEISNPQQRTVDAIRKAEFDLQVYEGEDSVHLVPFELGTLGLDRIKQHSLGTDFYLRGPAYDSYLALKEEVTGARME